MKNLKIRLSGANLQFFLKLFTFGSFFTNLSQNFINEIYKKHRIFAADKGNYSFFRKTRIVITRILTSKLTILWLKRKNLE